MFSIFFIGYKNSAKLKQIKSTMADFSQIRVDFTRKDPCVYCFSLSIIINCAHNQIIK